MTILVQLGIFFLILLVILLVCWAIFEWGESIMTAIVIVYATCVVVGCLLVLWSFAGGLAADLTQ